MRRYYSILLVYLLCHFVSASADTISSVRLAIIEECKSDLHVRETTPNCSPEIAFWCSMHGMECGVPWCAIWVGAKFRYCGVVAPLNAWSPSWFPPERIIPLEEAQPADLFSIYFRSLHRIGHVGFIDHVDKRDVYTYEGNTNQGGGREGYGVFPRVRDKDEVYKCANWIDERKRQISFTGIHRRGSVNSPGYPCFLQAA